MKGGKFHHSYRVILLSFIHSFIYFYSFFLTYIQFIIAATVRAWVLDFKTRCKPENYYENEWNYKKKKDDKRKEKKNNIKMQIIKDWISTIMKNFIFKLFLKLFISYTITNKNETHTISDSNNNVGIIW